MRIRDVVETLPTELFGRRVFSEPYETDDGTTIITATKVRGGGAAGKVGVTATPLGVFVIHDGAVKWEQAFDTTKAALLAEFVGLVGAMLVGYAIARRPPWPDVRITVTKS